MAMGLGAFTEGLQGGIQARDRMDIAREYKEKMRQENFTGALDIQGQQHSANLDYLAGGGSQEDFDKLWGRYNQSKDPALMRFGKWLGGKMGFFNEEAGAQKGMSVASPEVQEQAIPDKVNYMADGGSVDEERRRRMGAQDMMDMPGYRSSPVVDQPRAPRSIESEPVLKRTRRNQEAWGDQQDAYMEQMAGGSAAQRGDALRDYLGAGIARTAQGIKDVAADAGEFLYDETMLGSIAKGVGGFLGFDGGGASEGIPTGQQPQPQRGGEYPMPEDFDPDMRLYPEDEKAATDATVAAPKRTDAQMADKAIEDGEEMALENLDYKRLVDQGVRPNDLPQMSTQEWSDYRREQLIAMRMQGMNLKEAYEQVDHVTVNLQMRGFQREAQKAFLYMNTGQMDEAAMALSMAYQYFPNGSKVEFATFDDPKSGRPVLVARGYNEETGEPTGSPQIVTAERLAVMVEQMSKPEAFRTWTKDGHQLQLDIAKHEETKIHNKSMEDIHGYNAETDRMNALTRRELAQRGEGGGFDAGEQRQRNQIYRERVDRLVMEDEAFEDPALREDMGAIMARLGDMYPQASPNQIEQIAMKAFRLGREKGGSVEAGVEAAAALLQAQQGG